MLLIFRFTNTGGFALFFDYGHDGNRLTSSLRAYSKHKQVDILSNPGKIDVTADVDFGYLSSVLGDQCLIYGPVSQRHFFIKY